MSNFWGVIIFCVRCFLCNCVGVSDDAGCVYDVFKSNQRRRLTNYRYISMYTYVPCSVISGTTATKVLSTNPERINA